MNQEQKSREDKIADRIKEKDLSINVSWAINNATHLVSHSGNALNEHDKDDIKTSIKQWTKWYLELYQEVRHEEAEKLIDKENEDEKPL